MGWKEWAIVVGGITMATLLAVGYITHAIGGFIHGILPGTIVEQVGTAITGIGDAAFSAFWMALLIGLIVVAIILYIMAKVGQPS